MHFQGFQSAWKPHKPVVSPPVLEPKHVVLAPQTMPDSTLLVPSVKAPAPVVKEPSVPVETVTTVEAVTTTEVEMTQEGSHKRVEPTTTEVEMTQEGSHKRVDFRSVLTSPWMSIGLAAGLVLVFLWGLSCSMEVGRLTKQQNQLMVAILETLRQ